MKIINRYRLIAIMVVFTTVIAILSGCSGKAGKSVDTQKYDNESILISGLLEEDFEITVSELKKLASKKKLVVANRANGEEVRINAVGPLLETFLKQYGKKQTDFEAIRFTAKDKYSIAAGKDVLENQDIILAYADGKNALKDEDSPLRIVIPGERAMYWVRMLDRIDFETESNERQIEKIVLFDTAKETLPQEEYLYHESKDIAIKTKDIVEKYAIDKDHSIKNVYMEAGDGLKKDETKANFLQAYIKITGDLKPKFLAPQFPIGMHIDEILTINYGSTGFFFLDEAIHTMDKRLVDDKSGIGFFDMLEKVGTLNSDEYRFTDLEGNTIDMIYDELSNSLFYLDDEGRVVFDTGLSDKGVMKDLLTIEPIK